LNDWKFSEVWTEEHSYWLGLLHADGHCAKSGYSVSLELKTEDGYLVEEFGRFIGYDGEVKKKAPHEFVSPNGKTYMSSGTYLLQVSSKQMHADLTERGIRSRDKLVWLPPVGLRDYLRGMFDGNGSIVMGRSIGSWRWYYAGGLPACELFASVFKEGGYSCSVKKKGGYWQARCSSTDGALYMMDLMYKDCDGPMMRRKALVGNEQERWGQSTAPMPKSYCTQWDAEKKRWRVRMDHNGQRLSLGRFRTKGLAYAAYAKWSLMANGKKSPFWRPVRVRPIPPTIAPAASDRMELAQAALLSARRPEPKEEDVVELPWKMPQMESVPDFYPDPEYDD
jgi:hypothetical protein